MIYFVVLATIAWLPLTALSFSFTSEPEQPLVVVLYSNSTDVDFRWEFSLANGDIFSNIHVKRFQKDQGLASLVILGYYQARYKNVNTSLYNLDPNVSNGPSSGYVNFTIKDITKQLNNKDGSKADAQSIDYVYRLVVKIANILEPQVSSVETSVLLKVHNFEGPKNVNTTESEQFNVACSADGKPSPNLMLALPNGVEIKGTGSIDVNLTAYRNMTGMFNCTAENIVSVPQTKSAWLNVWYSASCTILPAIASEGDTVTLNISTTGNPGVINYNCTHPNGSVLTGKPPTFKVQRPDDGLYNCSVFNGIGERGYCTGKVTVHYTPKAKMTCPLSVCVNQTIDITCEADASPDNITYSLSYGTSVLNHAVNGHVSHNVRESGDQKFSCNASNTIGQGATVYCTVKVYEPPEIKDCWINGKATSKGNVVNGTGVSLTCNIAGSYNLSSARWTKDDREWKGVNITFLALHPHTTGTYYLTVYSGLECNKTVKANLSLTVTFPASCAFPQDVIQVTEGDNVILNVSSTGSPPVNEYIWTHPNGSRLTGNSILRFIASRQDTGTYHCSVYNGIGERGNCTRYVNVTYSAECEIYPNTPTVTVNESDLVDLTCKTNGNPEANDYIWNYPNGSSLPGSSVLSFIASRKDSTSYHCSVSNGVGDRGNCSRQVTVQYRARNVTIISCKDCCCDKNQNSDVTLNCSAEGVPDPTYHWTFSSNDGNVSTLETGQSLSIQNLTIEQSGIYTCIASNVLGKSNATKRINVLHKPRQIFITRHPEQAVEFRNIRLTCESSAYPPPEYIWYFNDTRLDNKTNKVLFLENITLNNAGVYVCFAKNELGNATNSTNLVVNWPLFCRMKIDMVWNATLLDKNSCQFKALVLFVTQTVKGIYINTTLVSVAVVGFVKGSVIAKVILYFGSNDGSLDLLKEAVRNNITINGSKLLGVEQGFEDLTTTTAPPTAPPTTPSPSDPTLIIVIAVVGGLVILLIVFVLCYCKKKKSNKDGKDDQEVAIAKGDEAAGTNTHPYSPSKYADRGPHTNPGYDSEDGPGSNNNINQSGPTKENEEPAYAAVDMSKKSLKKQKQNHDELTYAELGSFQTSGSQPNGGDIALEHLPKDKHTKMPEKYEETIYAEIIGSKKPGSDNHDGKAATNTPLNELPYKDAEADKDDTADKDAAADKEKDKVGANPSGKTPDPTKQLEQKVVVKEKDPANVPGKPQEQPPTNEDSGKGESHPEENSVTKF